MNKGEQYVDVVEAGHEVLEAIGAQHTWDAIKDYSDEFKRGAMWGMAWAMSHIYAYAPKYYARREEDAGEWKPDISM